MFNCVVQSLCELLVEICSVFLSVLCQNSQLVLLFVFVFVKIVLHPFECAVYVVCPLYNVFKYINKQSHKIEYLLCVFCPRSLSSLYCCILLSLHCILVPILYSLHPCEQILDNLVPPEHRLLRRRRCVHIVQLGVAWFRPGGGLQKKNICYRE